MNDERTPLRGNLSGVVEKTSRLNNEVGALDRLTQQIGTSKDTWSLRNQLKDKRALCMSLGKEASVLLKRDGQGADKYQAEKLAEQLRSLMDRCQRLTSEGLQKERQYPMTEAIDTHRYSDEFGTDTTGSDQLSSSFKKVEHDSSYDVENDLIRERNEEIIQLQRDFTDLAEVFGDVAKMVHEQQPMIDTIESNVQDATIKSDEGLMDIRKASEYQRSSRNKLCCLLLIGVLVLLGLAGFLVYWFAGRR